MSGVDNELSICLDNFDLLDDYEVISFLIRLYGKNEHDLTLLLHYPGLSCLVSWVKSGFDDQYLIEKGVNRDMRDIIKTSLTDNQLFNQFLADPQ